MRGLENRTLGKYDLVRELGRGSMGTVYLGNDPFTDRDVAIKVAHPESLNDANTGARMRKLFFNEAKVAGLLKHPSIIAVYDAGVEDDLRYIVMEYVTGGQTLRQYCAEENLLPLEDVVRVAFKCAKALDYAHRKGVIHRDIKPSNILLTDEMEVKLGDFSVALNTSADQTETQVEGVLGSPFYMSPEQVREEGVSAQSDIFSLGVVLYELLTGQHPFQGDNLGTIVHHIIEGPYQPVREHRPEIPAIVEHIVGRTLRKEPASRYRTGMDLAGDLSLVFDHIRLGEEELSGKAKFALISDLPFFSEFAESEIWEVINAGVWQDFQAGDEIILEGDVDNSFYVIICGEVSVRKGKQEVDVLGQGACFGEMGFIAHKRRTASILARGDVSVMRVRATLIERASLHCQLRFHKVFLNTLVERLSSATDTISHMT